MNDISFVRARIATIKRLANSLPDDEKTHKNTDKKLLLSYGFVPESLTDKFKQELKNELGKVSESPLTFTELASYSSWFALYPEKVAGEEKVTTSIHFPIKIGGGKSEVVAMIEAAMRRKRPAAAQDKKLLIAKARAQAIKLKLKLLKSKSSNLLAEYSLEIAEIVKKLVALRIPMTNLKASIDKGDTQNARIGVIETFKKLVLPDIIVNNSRFSAFFNTYVDNVKFQQDVQEFVYQAVLKIIINGK